jgi:hypothetical protein
VNTVSTSLFFGREQPPTAAAEASRDLRVQDLSAHVPSIAVGFKIRSIDFNPAFALR